MTEINLLCAADLHIGRQVGPGNSSQVNIAWNRLVDICLNSRPKIDALLLAGDVVDSDELFVEVHGILKKGISRLLEQGIAVIAIAGNHDGNVLHQLNRSFELKGFTLLGADEKWERKLFSFNGINLHIDGLSFTGPFMHENPLATHSRESVPNDELLIGLLHCDVDAHTSPYAPVKSSDFKVLPHQAWLLGHVHVPQEIHVASPMVRYCGSLQGLDISEDGPRGAWQLTIDRTGRIVSKSVPLAPFLWEQITINVSQLTSEEWQSQILRMIEEVLCQRMLSAEYVEKVGVRLTFEGRTPIFRELRRSLLNFGLQEDAGFRLENRWMPYFIESIKNHTRPAYDLESLARGGDFVAALARKLLAFKNASEQSTDLYEQIEAKLIKEPYLKQCEKAWPNQSECQELYLSQGYELLDELLEQRHL